MLKWGRWGKGERLKEKGKREKLGVTKSLAVVAGGRNEETYSKYAVGARIKQLPSRRQQQRGVGGGWEWIYWIDLD